MVKIIYGVEQGVFIVDAEDYEWLNVYKWRDHPDGYAQTYKDGTTVSMHRLIMGEPKGKMVDHINRLVNDNRRKNLRLSDASLNQANKIKSKNKSSIYKGVTVRKHGYEASIKKGDKYTYIGSFSSEESAANAYNYYAVKEFGEHARLNKVPFESKEMWSINKASQKLHSDFLGVHKNKNGHWRVRFLVAGKETAFGYYINEIAAANAYNHYIIKFRGKNAVLNDVEYMSIEECEKYSLKRVSNTSAYRGVSKRPGGKWLARIFHDNKTHEIGLYESEIEAATEYNYYIKTKKLDKALNLLPHMKKKLRIIVYYQKRCSTLDAIEDFLNKEKISFTSAFSQDEFLDRVIKKPVVLLLDENDDTIMKLNGFKPIDLIEFRDFVK